MLVDGNSVPDTDDDIAEAIANARTRLRLWWKRSLYSIAALLLSAALVYPFSSGQALYGYSEPFGTYLVYLSMFLFAVCVYCTALVWGAWRCLRDLEQGRT
jgi:hypothetical protein